jgi:hypothetical protein
MGCGKNEKIYIYTPDKKQCITVFNIDTLRYIMVGKHSKVPNSNYIKLDVSRVPLIGDALYMCWKDSTGWDMVVPKAKIIESKLDTGRFHFNNSLPKDKRGIPTAIKYSGDSGAVFGFELMRLIPNKGAIVEIK